MSRHNDHKDDQALSRNSDATLHVGNLFESVTEDVLWELFSQMGTSAEFAKGALTRARTQARWSACTCRATR